jgi:phosphoserine phosphatase
MSNSSVKSAFCFDLDGTITNQEILPIIARGLDLEDEINALTIATMQGVIPFKDSFKLRVKLLSSVPASRVREIVEEVTFSKPIADFIRKNTECSYIVTGNLDVWICDYVKKFGCNVLSATARIENDMIVGIDSFMDKGRAIASLKSKYDRIIAIGDGMNDAPMFEQSHIRIAYGGVHSPADDLIKTSDYVTYHENGLCNILSTLS